MASAWGKSWGLAFGSAWGVITGVPAPAKPNPLGGSTIRRAGGKRRVLRYVDPIQEQATDEQSQDAINTIAINAQPEAIKRARAVRELEHLMLLH